MDVSQGPGSAPLASDSPHLRDAPAVVNKSQLATRHNRLVETRQRELAQAYDRTSDRLWALIGALVVLLLATLLGREARADVITSFGGGVKLPATTSYVLQEECHTVLSFEPREREPSGFIRSCGGDNPMFSGWPIAYQREFKGGMLTFRGGWYHMSHWFDGGDDRETHLDCFCAELTVNWTERRRQRIRIAHIRLSSNRNNEVPK